MLTRAFIIAGLLTVMGFSGLKAQPVISDTTDLDFFLRRENVYRLFAHTAGLGGGFTKGFHKTVYRRNILEFDLLNMKSPKEVRTVYPWADNSKSYVYGKLNYIFNFRAGIGQERLLNRKPYWGGVEVRYYYHAGLSLAFEKPIYLYIINYSVTGDDYYLTTERFDPAKHSIDNIYGRAPWGNGFNEIQIKPGIYGKFGFLFDFGTYGDRVKAVEAGAALDFYPQGVEIMSETDPNYAFFKFYVSFNFGKRFNKTGSGTSSGNMILDQ